MVLVSDASSSRCEVQHLLVHQAKATSQESHAQSHWHQTRLRCEQSPCMTQTPRSRSHQRNRQAAHTRTVQVGKIRRCSTQLRGTPTMPHSSVRDENHMHAAEGMDECVQHECTRLASSHPLIMCVCSMACCCAAKMPTHAASQVGSKPATIALKVAACAGRDCHAARPLRQPCNKGKSKNQLQQKQEAKERHDSKTRQMRQPRKSTDCKNSPLCQQHCCCCCSYCVFISAPLSFTALSSSFTILLNHQAFSPFITTVHSR